MLTHFWLITSFIFSTRGYTNVLYSISDHRDRKSSEIRCQEYQSPSSTDIKTLKSGPRLRTLWTNSTQNINNSETIYYTTVENDPIEIFQDIIQTFLFGSQLKKGDNRAHSSPDDEDKHKLQEKQSEEIESIPDHYPTGQVLRAELYQNKSGVHLPMREYLHVGHCRLNVTMDFMQTAVNAFAIFLNGDLTDILRLPPTYVLHSARTISMMSIAREKLAATWTVIKDNKWTEEVTFQTLELYRPLFKYLNGKEIAKLNLSDNRILTYIGTHAELNRHQVGVVASTYIKLNKHWSEPKYLNLMNNLLCGVPMTFMRRIPENTYLQLSHQVFYHVRACDPLQRRFYLAMMTKSQALGKSYSWNARDVARLGLLLAEVDGPDLSAINPEAVAGITAHVMQTMDPQNLRHFTDMQLKFMGQKPLNILTRKLKLYEDRMKIYNSELNMKSALTLPFLLLFFVFK